MDTSVKRVSPKMFNEKKPWIYWFIQFIEITLLLRRSFCCDEMITVTLPEVISPVLILKKLFDVIGSSLLLVELAEENGFKQKYSLLALDAVLRWKFLLPRDDPHNGNAQKWKWPGPRDRHKLMYRNDLCVPPKLCTCSCFSARKQKT